MKSPYYLLVLALIYGCGGPSDSTVKNSDNPFYTDLNESIDYASVTADDIYNYANFTMEAVVSDLEKIKSSDSPTFNNIFVEFDKVMNNLSKALSNSHTLYWVSPDSLSRAKGLAGYQLLDSLYNQISSDKALYQKLIDYTETEEYSTLEGHRKKYVNDLIADFKHSGVNLQPENLAQFKQLNAEVTKLSAQYSDNMNTANRFLVIDEAGAKGLSENFKNTYRFNEIQYKIPVIPATRQPVMGNASSESTRKGFIMEYNNRGANGNLEILDELIQKRYEIGVLMGYTSYAGYNLNQKMAGNSATVWNFLNDLIEKSRPKAIKDLQKLSGMRNEILGIESDETVKSWDVSYYRNQLLKTEYQVDHEKIREYLTMDSCLKGLLDIYQEVLGFEFRKVENPSVWHEEVEMYEVYKSETLQGKFYLDLFPRPNKESWFYGVGLTPGKLTDEGYEVPVAMLLGNFTRPTEDLPSMVSHGELSTLFHEFGHIMDGMSYRGEFSYQSDSKRDFGEAMSQIFENWIWDYDILSTFAMHYKTGEVLPKETFDNMLAAKNVTSGLSAIGSLRNATYDMMIYDKYDPDQAVPTDDIWRMIDKEMGVRDSFVEGTHPQASWIHINGYPVYYYGYIWSDVFAQDMFTQFEQNGLLSQETGIRYRDIILANGSQREVLEVVEDFLGRPSNNEAYIRSLGLE